MQASLFLSRWLEPALHDDTEVAAWVRYQRGLPRLQAIPARLDQLNRWQIDPHSGNIHHENGRFFSIIGLNVRHRVATRELTWDQPIIDQPEVGILGIIAKPIGGILHFCLQAKEEPGNIGGIQLSPTVQATYSNYSGAHGGARPPFLEHFLSPPPDRLIISRLQSEDGGRFLYKSNRNMIVSLDDDADVQLPEGFIWLTLRQVAGLLHQHNLVHATTRSILAALFCCCNKPALAAVSGLTGNFPVSTPGDMPPKAALSSAIDWLDQWKATHHFRNQQVDLNSLKEWRIDEDGFLSHREGRFFRVIGLNISGADREVSSWSQPILCNPEIGIIGLLQREQGGRRQFLMQAKAEAGNRGVLQLAPTVQFTPGNYLHNPRLAKPFLFEEFKGHRGFPVIFETLQAEEGARFYRESHHHRILRLPAGATVDTPADFRWFEEDELGFLLHLGETVNSCARSILSCLL
jgi:oxidase EvaA